MSGQRTVILAGAAVLIVVGGAGFALYRAQAEQQAVLDGILADADAAFAVEPVDNDELSRLMARMDKVPGHEGIADFQRIRARIHLHRGSQERAWTAISPLALGIEPRPGDLALGARVALELGGRLTGTEARDKSRLAMELGTRWAAVAPAGERADALEVALQGALRCAEPEEARGLVEQLAAEGGDTAALWSELAPVLLDGRAGNPGAIRTSLPPPSEAPPEALAGLALSLIRRAGTDTAGRRDPEEIQDMLRLALNRAPSVILVRDAAFLAALLRGAVAKAMKEPREVRAAARDVLTHTDFLVKHGDPGDPRMERWRKAKEGAEQQLR